MKGWWNLKEKTLTFKEFLAQTTGYRSVNDFIRKQAKKGTSPYDFEIAKEHIEEEYLKYCNMNNKKFKPKWH